MAYSFNKFKSYRDEEMAGFRFNVAGFGLETVLNAAAFFLTGGECFEKGIAFFSQELREQ